jgi:predicted Na+-dependent transporter
VDRPGLLTELLLSVTLPLVVCVALRTRFPGLTRASGRALDLSALCVVLIVYVAAGQAHDIVLSRTIVPAVLLSLGLQCMSYAIGSAVVLALRLRGGAARAILFPIGMREFGIATAVALSVAPRAAGMAGVYGVMLMISGPALARILKPADTS